MKSKTLAFGAAIVATVLLVPGTALATPQKWSVSLAGSCKDLKMDESTDEDDCQIKVTITPKTPTRTITLQIKSGDTWKKVSSSRTKNGSVTLDISAYDAEEETWLDGTYRFRVIAAKSGSQKAYTGKQYAITFTPDEGDGSEDSGDDEDSSTAATTPKKTTSPTTTTPKSTTPTTPGHGGSSATTTAPTSPGHTPTNTMAPGGDATWFLGTSPSSLGSFCMAADPTMYVGATICNSISSRMSLSQFKSLISSISNSAPQYKRNGFCTQAMYGVGGMTYTQVTAKCAEANAGR